MEILDGITVLSLKLMAHEGRNSGMISLISSLIFKIRIERNKNDFTHLPLFALCVMSFEQVSEKL